MTRMCETATSHPNSLMAVRVHLFVKLQASSAGESTTEGVIKKAERHRGIYHRIVLDTVDVRDSIPAADKV